MRKPVVLAGLVTIFSGIAILFWHSEWKYNLPTPVPCNYKTVQQGVAINVQSWMPAGTIKPVFLHFFNPGCPCSRFNIPHFKSLVKQHGDKVDFAVVVMSSKKYTVTEIRKKFGLNLPVFFDSAIAATCGVYSTPQAVLLSPDRHLYYRGNYNKSRYCADEKSFYARIALESLLQKKPIPDFEAYAAKAYGCQLPICKKDEN